MIMVILTKAMVMRTSRSRSEGEQVSAAVAQLLSRCVCFACETVAICRAVIVSHIVLQNV